MHTQISVPWICAIAMLLASACQSPQRGTDEPETPPISENQTRPSAGEDVSPPGAEDLSVAPTQDPDEGEEAEGIKERNEAILARLKAEELARTEWEAREALEDELERTRAELEDLRRERERGPQSGARVEPEKPDPSLERYREFQTNRKPAETHKQKADKLHARMMAMAGDYPSVVTACQGTLVSGPGVDEYGRSVWFEGRTAGDAGACAKAERMRAEYADLYKQMWGLEGADILKRKLRKSLPEQTIYAY